MDEKQSISHRRDEMRDFIIELLIKSAHLFLEAVIPHTLRENTRDVVTSRVILEWDKHCHLI